MARRLIRCVVLAGLLLVSASASATPCTELPVLFIVQDKSGSMAAAPDGSNPTTSTPSKWDSASAVVPSIASQFANRFRFGVGMFPNQSTTFNCATGGVVSAVPSSAAQVTAAYNAAAPGGGTPTAETLRVAKSYLQSLNLATPAHVLLITDGLPNCNTSNNAATCATSTPGCLNTSTCSGSSCCGLGAKDCLDSTNSSAAAAELLAAGFKVFVVGFGTSLTSGNNRAVLDAMAAAGGTGTSYVASNQAALSSALNQIALNTATCCQNVCTAGASVCNGTGARQTCQLDPQLGCTTWVTQTCPTQSTCTSGSCVTCSNQCTAGATRCSGGGVQQCVAGAGGCTSWVTAQTCDYGELCQSAACTSCQACNIGASRCTANNGVESCDWNVLTGCTQWVASQCQAGSVCANGACSTCNSTCTAGATRCNGLNVEACQADANGCTAWRQTSTCSTFCSGGACGTCGTSCQAGATRCNGNGTETCGTDANGCPAWSSTTACAASTFCTGGRCQTCATTCTQGARRCGASGAIEECRLDPTGCTTWAQAGACNVAAGERCDQGVCIPPCQDQCTLGSGQCTASGAPQRCEQAPTGCTLWRDQPACASGAVCITGDCRAPCAGGEMESCPTGFVCTGLTQGRVCMPDTSDAGTLAVVDAGSSSPTPLPVDAGPGTQAQNQNPTTNGRDDLGDTRSIGARGTGCGCTSLEGLLPLLGLAALSLRRRRR